ncbi:MAG TPA: class I SAM-dependent methyltransferase [Pseudonocardiaceae bacterium]|jgi:SAM-dependent methyltransferase|nr:class I SAM-dependent methyltransferase [Pseudonocardiaceae bacterium]
MTDYVLAQSADQLTERERLTLIQAFQDSPTIRYLTAAGVSGGWHCLDAGAGGGSITRWLADRVGPSGTVLATDLETDMLAGIGARNVTVQRHDVRTDPLPDKGFDLVHTRLLLTHLPERDDVLGRLVAAVRAGGAIVLGDIDFGTLRLSRPDPTFDKVRAAFFAAVRLAGWDAELGPKLPSMLERHGVAGVEGEGLCGYQRGGAAAPTIMSLTLRRLRPLLLREGVAEDELDHVHGLLVDPAIALHGPTLWAAWGTVG